MKAAADRRPILVLGLGNPLLRDDGVGLELLGRLRRRLGARTDVECVDGGTQGVALLGYLCERSALLILDALALGTRAGEVTVLHDPLRHAAPRGIGAHGANADGLLAAAALLGDLPERTVLVGVRPEELRTGIGLSAAVERALPEALDAAEAVLETWRSMDGRDAFDGRGLLACTK